jgi:hypothetical protein
MSDRIVVVVVVVENEAEIESLEVTLSLGGV